MKTSRFRRCTALFLAVWSVICEWLSQHFPSTVPAARVIAWHEIHVHSEIGIERVVARVQAEIRPPQVILPGRWVRSAPQAAETLQPGSAVWGSVASMPLNPNPA